MSLRALFVMGLTFCFIASCVGSVILYFVCFTLNLLLGGSIERKPKRAAKQRLLDDLAAFERAKNAGKLLDEDFPSVETNPYAIPRAAPGQMSKSEAPRKQPLPVPRVGKAFAICFAASSVQFIVRYLLLVMTKITGSSQNLPPNQAFNGLLDQLSANLFLIVFVGTFILAAILKYHLPTKWWIALLIAAMHYAIMMGSAFLLFEAFGRH